MDLELGELGFVWAVLLWLRVIDYFGLGSRKESEETGRIGREELLDGVIRIPRVMMLVDKVSTTFIHDRFF